MPSFLSIHEENQVDRILLESRWTEIARNARAEWQVTLFTAQDPGRRWCEWEAPDRAVIEEIFRELGIKWSEIIEVELTSASRWRLWEMETGRRLENCWEITLCGRQPEDFTTAEEIFCPAAVSPGFEEGNREPFAGTYCWKAVETFCQAKIHGTLAENRIPSSLCPFF